MRMPIGESWGERDADGERDALPSAGDPAADPSRARRLRSVDHRRRALVAGALGAVLVVAGVALWPSSDARSALPAGAPSAGPATPGADGRATTQTGARRGSCAGTVRLVSSGGTAVTLAPTTTPTPTLEVEVGDVVRLTSDGPCGSALHLAARSEAGLSPVEDQAVEARKTGSTKVVVTHGMCAQLVPPQPGCLGGIVPDGQATVVVRSR